MIFLRELLLSNWEKNNPFVAMTQMRKHDSTELILFVLKEDFVLFRIDSEKIYPQRLLEGRI